MFAASECADEVIDMFRRCHNHDAADACVDELLYRMINDRLVVKGEEVLIRSQSERAKSRPRTACQNNGFPDFHRYSYVVLPHLWDFLYACDIGLKKFHER